IESFNGRLRDECLNEHWFPTLLHARTEIETWRREYNEARPKKTLGGLTPAAYAEQLAAKAATMKPVHYRAPLLNAGGRRGQPSGSAGCLPGSDVLARWRIPGGGRMTQKRPAACATGLLFVCAFLQVYCAAGVAGWRACIMRSRVALK